MLTHKTHEQLKVKYEQILVVFIQATLIQKIIMN